MSTSALQTLSDATFRPLLLVDDADAARQGLAAALGDVAGVLLASESELSETWPEYVVARARTSGALVSSGAREGATFLRLGTGTLFGRSAVAGLVAGSLVFLIDAPGADQDADLNGGFSAAA